MIWPYIKQSVKHYQMALKKSMELQIYSEWVGKSYRGLSEIEISGGKFKRFAPMPLYQEAFSLQVLDETGTVVKGLFETLKESLQYGVSREDFKKLSQAIASGKESLVLKAASAILNKDPDNVVAINSLAYFYLNNNRWSLGALILNRLASGKSRSPVIMNNLAVVSLKYGNPREAVTYLKKALSSDRTYSIARVNLANIFVQQYDYRNAYRYYKNDYNDVIQKWPANSRKAISLLNNYGVALTGVKQWDPGLFVFKNLSASPSPLPEVLFNYALFLTERSKGEDREKARRTLGSAKGLLDELGLYSGSTHLRGKLRLLSNSINARLKGLRPNKTSGRRKK